MCVTLVLMRPMTLFRPLVRSTGRCRRRHRTLRSRPVWAGRDVGGRQFRIDRQRRRRTGGADALNAFIGALNDTGSELGLIDFDTLATVVSPLIPLSTASGSFAFFTNYANNFRGTAGRTGTTPCSRRSVQAPISRCSSPTAMPNEYVNQPPHSGHTGNPSSGNRPLSFAVNHANTIKAAAAAGCSSSVSARRPATRPRSSR